MTKGNGAYVFSDLGNTIYDGLLYYFSGDFADVRGVVNGYGGKDIHDDSVYLKFREKLLGVKWTDRKAHAFIAHWLDYAKDVGPDEEEMDFDTALKDRSVDCEEHRTVANALLNWNGGKCPAGGDAVDLFYIPEDPKDEAEGHATKIISWKPNVVTLCNWGLINHYQSDMGFIRDFISKANCYDKLSGRWEDGRFVHAYVKDGSGTLEETWFTKKVEQAEKALPLKFDIGSLGKVDAEYMKGFKEHRDRLAEKLNRMDRGTVEYAGVLREIRVRNKILRRNGYVPSKSESFP
jgi:hypothetical protein